MAIYAIGDLHLSLTANKSMSIFPGWENYTEKIVYNWKKNINPEDTVVLAGDTSWGMSLEEAIADFKLLHSLPGRKLILKGNHDYWWASYAKMMKAFAGEGLDSLDILHNNSYEVEGMALCGSRGWLFESGQAQDDKIIRREAIRIQASLDSVQDKKLERVLFLHYPPLFGDQVQRPFLDIMADAGIKRCYYGHIHGAGHRSATIGPAYGIHFSMISADYVSFMPVKVDAAL